jgi:hypothetical protein
MDKGDEVALVDDACRKSERVIVAETIRIPPKSEAVGPVRSDAKGLCLVTSMGRKMATVTVECGSVTLLSLVLLIRVMLAILVETTA